MSKVSRKTITQRELDAVPEQSAEEINAAVEQKRPPRPRRRVVGIDDDIIINNEIEARKQAKPRRVIKKAQIDPSIQALINELTTGRLKIVQRNEVKKPKTDRKKSLWMEILQQNGYLVKGSSLPMPRKDSDEYNKLKALYNQKREELAKVNL